MHAAVVLDCFETLPANPRTNRTSGSTFPVDEARHKQTKLGLAQHRPARSTAHERVANLNARGFQQPHLLCKLVMFAQTTPKAPLATGGSWPTVANRAASLPFSLHGEDCQLAPAQLERISPDVLHARYLQERTSVRLLKELLAQD